MSKLSDTDRITANKILEYLFNARTGERTMDRIVNDLKRGSGTARTVDFLMDKNLIRISSKKNNIIFYAIARRSNGEYFQTLEQYEEWVIADRKEQKRLAEKEDTSHQAKIQSAKSMAEIAASLDAIGAELKTEVSELKGAIDDLKKANEDGSNHAKWNNRIAGLGILFTLVLGAAVFFYGDGILNRPAENNRKNQESTHPADKEKPDPHFGVESDSLRKNSADSSHRE